MKDNLIIIGANGHGKVVADIAMKMKKWENISFLDDDQSLKKNIGFEVIGSISVASKYKGTADFIVAIGNNAIRAKVQEKLENEGCFVTKLIHPNAVIGMNVRIGMGTVVMAGVVINSDSKIGKGCIINTNSSLDHDNFIEDYVHISPGVNVAGTVKIGENSWIGIGSAISNNVDICGYCKVGAGAVVVKDIIKSGTYVGVPVRRVLA